MQHFVALTLYCPSLRAQIDYSETVSLAMVWHGRTLQAFNNNKPLSGHAQHVHSSDQHCSEAVHALPNLPGSVLAPHPCGRQPPRSCCHCWPAESSRQPAVQGTRISDSGTRMLMTAHAVHIRQWTAASWPLCRLLQRSRAEWPAVCCVETSPACLGDFGSFRVASLLTLLSAPDTQDFRPCPGRP